MNTNKIVDVTKDEGKNQNVEDILIQFIAPQKLVEVSSLEFKSETDQASHSREKALNGVAVLQPQPGRAIDVSAFRESLLKAGFQIVKATITARSSDDSRKIFAISFAFKKTESDGKNDFLEQEFDRLADMSFWHGCSYLNPPKDGGANSWISINFAARVQRFVGEDPTNPVMVGVKDKNGNKTGSRVPVQANCRIIWDEEARLIEPLAQV